MKMTMTVPCSNCPFRKEGGIRLRRERARDIARSQIQAQGGTFPCHKTVTHDDDGEHVPSFAEQYCAGALAFALNVGSMNQFMRVMVRLKAWRPKAIKSRDQVFASVPEMLNAQGKR